MSNIQKLNSDRITIVNKFKTKTQTLLEQIKVIYEKNTISTLLYTKSFNTLDQTLIFLDDLLSKQIAVNDIKNKIPILQLIENNMLISKIFDIIKIELHNILSVININEDMPLNYISETHRYLKLFNAEFNKVTYDCNEIDKIINQTAINTLFEQFITSSKKDIKKDIKKVLDGFISLSEEFKKYKYTYFLYAHIYNKILLEINNDDSELDSVVNSNAYKKTYEKILDIHEQNKDYVLSILAIDELQKPKKVSKSHETSLKTNPELKSYGLVPISNLLTIDQISEMIWPKSKAVKTIDEFINLCKTKRTDLITIKEYLNRGIDYNVLDLMNFEKSKNFDILNNSNDGITQGTTERFTNIKYISSINKQFKFTKVYKYDYMSNINDSIIVIEELAPDQYHILSNQFKDQFNKILDKTSIKDFIKFINNTSSAVSRIDVYNTIINKNIVKNMFLGSKPDMTILEQKALTVDPKYLRHEIYTNIISKYKELDAHHKIPNKSIHTFSKLFHNKAFEQIFSNMISKQYNTYFSNTFSDGNTKNIKDEKKLDISTSEVYSSFVFSMYIYERDFKKKMHDNFIIEMHSIVDLDKDALFIVFEKILNRVLNDVITNDSNLLQSLEFKTEMLKFA